jgi:uncharacterized phiE125 gp8 family phage protein
VNLELISTTPGFSLVSLSEVKKAKRIFQTMEDALLTDWIVAIEHLETEYELAIVPREWALYLPEFPSFVTLPKPPLRYDPAAASPTNVPESAITITYLNTSGATVTLPRTDYFAILQDQKWRLQPATAWPATSEQPRAVKIQFGVGYSAGAKVPMAIRQAVMLLTAHFYQHRDPTFEEPKISMIDRETAFGINRLMKPYKVVPAYGRV